MRRRLGYLARRSRARERRGALRERPLFETRTQVWRQVGLESEIARSRGQQALGRVVLLLVLLAGVLVVFSQRRSIFPADLDTEIRVGTVIALVVLGFGLARYLGRGMVPALFRRMDPATAGTVGFLARLSTLIVVSVIALRIAGVETRTLALGGAFTAVVLGLAAQQTLGNIFAGLVLLSTRPFQVGDRVRLQGGSLGGELEGIVGSLGLFYTTLVQGADRILIPNSAVVQVAVKPRREPERVELRARFDAEASPAEIQRLLDETITVPLRYPPDVQLEELEGDELVVRIAVTPQSRSDGARLAEQVLAAVRENRGAATDDGARAGDDSRDGSGTQA